MLPRRYYCLELSSIPIRKHSVDAGNLCTLLLKGGLEFPFKKTFFGAWLPSEPTITWKLSLPLKSWPVERADLHATRRRDRLRRPHRQARRAAHRVPEMRPVGAVPPC